MDIYDDYAHLARLALSGKTKDIRAIIKKSLRKIEKDRPDIATFLKKYLSDNMDESLIRGKAHDAIPVDIDSRLDLLNEDNTFFDKEPKWPNIVQNELLAVIQERRKEYELKNVGLHATKSLLFVGPPGVGKTLAAKWLAYQLNRPLFTLNLASVMSSFLGRTGNNIRSVIEYSKNKSSVLFLDEFDSIAKRRNDETEVGELKRLVTVLLQEVDNWPEDGVLIAATNHPELLDPAVWRRFERVIEFPNPNSEEILLVIMELLGNDVYANNNAVILSILLEGESYSEVSRRINLMRKESILNEVSLDDIIEINIHELFKDAPKDKKIKALKRLIENGISQRKINYLTHMSRDTIRKYSKLEVWEDGE